MRARVNTQDAIAVRPVGRIPMHAFRSRTTEPFGSLKCMCIMNNIFDDNQQRCVRARVRDRQDAIALGQFT